jgi:hypothetical protein
MSDDERGALPASKLQRLKDALMQGDARTALKIAAYFPSLGEHKAAITRGWEACARPEMYRQMGRDPQTLIDAGVEALRERYEKA